MYLTLTTVYDDRAVLLFGCLAFRYVSSGFDCLFAVILNNYSNIFKIFEMLFYLHYFEKNQSKNNLFSYNFSILSRSILKEKQSVRV